MTTSHPALFEPIRIGPVTAKNRFYAVPHATGHGHLQLQAAHAVREMKARGGWGVVASQIAEIDPTTDAASHPMDRIWAGDVVKHAAQVASIKQHGALAAIELGHMGMRARNFTTGEPVWGPSALPILRPEIPLQAKAMDGDDIRAFRQSHRAAVARAIEADYDIVYVYAAHDLSLLSHFLSRRTNQRTDEYGGSLANRARLLREVLEDAQAEAAGRVAIALRFSIEEFGVDQPLQHDGEGRDVVQMLAELPDLWDVNLSGWSADSASSRFAGEGFQEPFTAFVKKITSRPVVGVGRYTSPDRMVAMIKSGQLDLIGAARPSIADPYLPNKVAADRVEDIRECIGCNVCVSMDSYGVPIRCTQNPTISEEVRWHPEVVPVIGRARHVLIVGGGPAGLECALTLARSGAEVTVADGRPKLGGRAVLESGLAGLAAWRRVADYRLGQLRGLGNVTLHTHSSMTAATVAEFDADRIVLATGSHWRADGVGRSRFTAIPGMDAAKALTPDDIMAGETPDGRVLIYDDEHNYMGGVIAEHLARRGAQVTLATPLDTISAWTVHTLEQRAIVARLHGLGVRLLTASRIVNADSGGVRIISALTGGAAGGVAFDRIVMVGARLPDATLFDALQARPHEGASVSIAGDCVAPGILQAAVYSGHRVARKLLSNIDIRGFV